MQAPVTVKQWAQQEGICESHARNLLNMAVKHGQATVRKENGVNRYALVPQFTRAALGSLDVTGTVSRPK